MILSRNEIAATLHKAARGQGMPLGHADVFVRAAVLALGAYGDFAHRVSHALEGPHNCTKTRVAMAGPIAIDALLCGDDEVTLSKCDVPELLVAMTWDAFDRKGLSVIVDVMDEGCILRRTDDPLDAKLAKSPLDIPTEDWAVWQDWAARTYVPATEASRLGGAGAGLTDND